MSRNHLNRSALSQIDAFFVAYQQRAGILLQLGVEIEVAGHLRRDHLEHMLRCLVSRWPQLGQRLGRRRLRLAWQGESRLSDMLQVCEDKQAVTRWRNEPIDPFAVPPFQVLWVPGNGKSLLSFRAHHAVMDGESFFAVCAEAGRLLAQSSCGRPALPEPEAGVKLTDLVSVGRLLRSGKLKSMWRYTRYLAAESRAGRSCRLAMKASTPGDTATCERELNRPQLDALKRRASSLGIGPAWLCAAAWMRAIHKWNVSCGAGSNAVVSLEVPVSLRRGRSRNTSPGNFISPLVLFGDASRSLDELAGALKDRLMMEVRQRSHFGTPLFTAPSRFLPWAVFRRVAVNTTSTGFATSHFTWLEQKADIHAEIAALSEGALEIIAQRIYTPVCLHMGAAFAAIAWPDRLQLLITHRLTAFSIEEASILADLLIAEMGGGERATAQQEVV
jgi:hypothetical protein